jgi:hypothetical protein
MSAALWTRLQVEFPQLDEAFFDRLFAFNQEQYPGFSDKGWHPTRTAIV